MAQSTDSISTNWKAILGNLVILGFPKKIAMMKAIREELKTEGESLLEKHKELFAEVERQRALTRKKSYTEEEMELSNLLGTLDEIGI